jgi:hypothetical protein
LIESERFAVTSRFPRSPYPKGWFQVGWSHELEPGEVKALQNFGEHLVMWRGEKLRDWAMQFYPEASHDFSDDGHLVQAEAK